MIIEDKIRNNGIIILTRVSAFQIMCLKYKNNIVSQDNYCFHFDNRKPYYSFGKLSACQPIFLSTPKLYLVFIWTPGKIKI